MATKIGAIAGLGNPGAEYERTRHNVGFDFVHKLTSQHTVTLREQSRFQGLTAQVNVASHPVRLLMPLTYMNDSGLSVQAFLHYYRLKPESLLVVYDELDLQPGALRLQQNGGTAGHKGIKSIVEALGGQRNFWRLRIGVGRPKQMADKNTQNATSFLLSRAADVDQEKTDAATDIALHWLHELVAGDRSKVMNALHGRLFPEAITLGDASQTPGCS